MCRNMKVFFLNFGQILSFWLYIFVGRHYTKVSSIAMGPILPSMWPGSPAITGHQRDVQGIYMVLNAREPAIYAKEWTLGW